MSTKQQLLKLLADLDEAYNDLATRGDGSPWSIGRIDTLIDQLEAKINELPESIVAIDETAKWDKKPT